jgi:PAS domain S-box-containing protein
LETNLPAAVEPPSRKRASSALRAERGEVAGAEISLGFNEIFFSRTDRKGKILFGNSLFQKVSGYSLEELQHKSHSFVRHPDMPRGLFWLMWDTIEKGEPFGGYIKNKARDGRFYWIYAIVTPMEDGYLSVRIKPSSPLLKVIEQEYAVLLAAEKDPSFKPAESAQLFLCNLWEHGFRDHCTFMATALGQELKSRDEHTGRAATPVIQFTGLAESARELLKQAQDISSSYRAHRFVPLNLRLQAAQLGRSGSTIAAISTNYDALSASINDMIGNFTAAAAHVLTTVNSGLFLFCVAQIQKEVRDKFKAERPAPTAEILLLERQWREYEAKAAEGLRAISADAMHFDRVCSDLKRASSGLETARLLGKVESARLECAGSGLNKLLGDLKRRQTNLVQKIQAMLALNRSIERETHTLLTRIGR